MKDKYPDKFVLSTSFEPRDGVAGIPAFKEKVKRYSTGVKLHTAEWKVGTL
jgi:hypothetical protein